MLSLVGANHFVLNGNDDMPTDGQFQLWKPPANGCVVKLTGFAEVSNWDWRKLQGAMSKSVSLEHAVQTKVCIRCVPHPGGLPILFLAVRGIKPSRFLCYLAYPPFLLLLLIFWRVGQFTNKGGHALRPSALMPETKAAVLRSV